MTTLSSDWEKYKVEDRYILQGALSTVKNDPIYALVELITNSDLSYQNLEKQGIDIGVGIIAIDVYPYNKEAIYIVRDFAEGMNDKDMEQKVKRIGGDTSGLTGKIGGRSFFGRGLKEVMIAYGCGEVISIKDETLYTCKSYNVHIKGPDIQRIYSGTIEKLGFKPRQNGTIVKLIAKREEYQRKPQFETLARALRLHYSLRDINSNPKRKIILNYYHTQTKKLRDSEEIQYAYPLGDLILKKEFQIDGYPDAIAQIEIFKSHEPLLEASKSYEQERGFLLCSTGAIHDISLFDFDHHSAAGIFWGKITCHYIDVLLRDKNEMVIEPSRSGLNWKHVFCQNLKKAVQKIIKPVFIQAEQDIQKKGKKWESEQTQKRISSALRKLNELAKLELADIDGGGKGLKNKPGTTPPKSPVTPHIEKAPPNGFSFMPSYIQAIVDKETTLTLKANLKEIKDFNSAIIITSDSEQIEVLTPTLNFEKDSVSEVVDINDKKIKVVKTKARILAKTSGSSGTIKAFLNGREAHLKCETITERIGTGGGIFSNYECDPEADLNQRVQYVRGTGVIRIATKAPSLIPYFGADGKKQDTTESRTMIAEMILSVFCEELTRQMIVNDKIPLIGDDPASYTEQLQSIQKGFMNKYAKIIHDIIVK